MPRRLGVDLTTERGFRHAIGLARAAARAGVCTEIFVTGEGVQATLNPAFADLPLLARVSICESSYFRAGFRGRVIPGLGDKDFTTQGRHAEIVDSCDRYVLL